MPLDMWCNCTSTSRYLFKKEVSGIENVLLTHCGLAFTVTLHTEQ